MKRNDDGMQELDELREAYRANPDDRHLGAKLGQVYTDRGWLNEAEELLRDLTERFADDYPLLLDYGNLLFRQERYDDALKIFGKLTVLKPERIEGWNNLGIVQLTKGDYEGARASFASVLELEPDNCGALLNLGNYHERKGEIDKAIELFERAVVVRRDFADGWYNLGNAYLKVEKNHQAIDAFGKALRYQPEFASALKNLGFAYERVGDLDVAEQHYRHALELNRADAALYVNLATIYTEKKLYDEAKDHYLRAVKLAPKSPGGWMGLRHLSLLRGDITTYVRATLAVMHRLDATEAADSARRLRELKHFDEAGQILKQADRLSLRGDELDIERLLHYQRTGGNEVKLTALLKRLNSIPDPSDTVRAGLGFFYLTAGDKERAAELLGSVRAKGIAEERGCWEALERLGRWSEARESLESYLREHQECAEAWLHLARVALGEGHISEAQRHLVRARREGLVDLELLERVPELRRMYESLGVAIPE